MATTDPTIVYEGAVMLAGRMELPQGDGVLFWLDGDYDENPFKRYRFDKAEPSSGAQFMAVFVEIDDMGDPVDQIQRQRFESIDKGELPVTPTQKDIQICAIVCKDPRFHQFIEAKIHHLGEKEKRDMAYSLPHRFFKKGYEALKGPYADEFAKHFVYWWCGITSRAQLGFKPKATRKWRVLEKMFYVWRAESE